MGDGDNHAGHHHPGRGSGIAHHVQQGGAHVEVAVVVVEEQHRTEVQHQRDGTNDGHDAAVHLGGVLQATDGFDDQQGGHHHQGSRVGLGGQDGAAVVAETAPSRGTAQAEAHGEQRQRYRRHIGEVVGGVGEQAERVGDDAEHHLHHHEHDVQPEGKQQASLAAHTPTVPSAWCLADAPVNGTGRHLRCRPGALVVETGVDPVTPRFSGVCSAD